MPIVLQDPGIGGGLAQALSGISGGIASGLERRSKNRLLKEEQQDSRTAQQVTTNWLGTYKSDLSVGENISVLAQSMDRAGVSSKVQQPILQKIIENATGKVQERAEYEQYFGDQKTTPAPAPKQEVSTSSGVLEDVVGPGGQEMVVGEETTVSTPQQPRPDLMAGKTDEELVLGSAHPNKNIAALHKSEIEKRKLGLQREDVSDKRWVQERDFHTKVSDDSVARINEMSQAVPKKRMAFQMAEDAVLSGEVGAFSPANIARRTGIREFQTAKGKQLETASKEHLIPNLSRVSAKAQNMWLEQMFASMFPEIGVSKEANMASMIMLRGENELEDMEVKVAREQHRLDREDTKSGERSGFVKRDIDERVDEIMEPIRDEALRKVSFQLRENWEQEKGIPWLYDNYNKQVSKGTPLTQNMMKAMVVKQASKNKVGVEGLKVDDYKTIVKNAKKLGYTIPTQEEVVEWGSK